MRPRPDTSCVIALEDPALLRRLLRAKEPLDAASHEIEHGPAYMLKAAQQQHVRFTVCER